MSSYRSLSVHHRMQNRMNVSANPTLIQNSPTAATNRIVLQFERNPGTNAVIGITFYNYEGWPTSRASTYASLTLRDDEVDYIEPVLYQCRKELLALQPESDAYTSVAWVLAALERKMNEHIAAKAEFALRMAREVAVEPVEPLEIQQISGLLELLSVESDEVAEKGIDELMENLRL
jgi:hypothetical protein